MLVMIVIEAYKDETCTSAMTSQVVDVPPDSIETIRENLRQAYAEHVDVGYRVIPLADARTPAVRTIPTPR